MTIAISLLVHGEAVRFNRGQARGDDYDFKYLMGRDGKVYPYVSSQCFKRYWRESLPGPASPIIRAKSAAGKEKNQAYTDGNPILYVDDDLFGYMIAGAVEPEEEHEIDLETPGDDGKYFFEANNLRDIEKLRQRLLETNELSMFVLPEASEIHNTLRSESSSGENIRDAIIQALNNVVQKGDLPSEDTLEKVGFTARQRRKFLEAKTEDDKREAIRGFLMKAFRKELQEKIKRPTTRRTAPIRMHALVAFSGVKTAKDFQTFSRDVPYTGKDSILNPMAVGIYTAWLKTRILIESHRIGRFNIGENMDLLEEQGKDLDVKTEQNPYTRNSDMLRFVELDERERTARLRVAIRALADIGNKQGPASGALHDGSLRPKAFVAGMMTCADSPLDDVWKGGNDEGVPFLDVGALVDSIEDWKDLFATRKLYFGLPHDLRTKLEETIKAALGNLGFDSVIDSPRKALLRLSEEAVL